MSQMDGKGPENKGSQTGRKLGACTEVKDKDDSLFGKGMGKRRKIDGDNGLGKRLRYNQAKSL